MAVQNLFWDINAVLTSMLLLILIYIGLVIMLRYIRTPSLIMISWFYCLVTMQNVHISIIRKCRRPNFRSLITTKMFFMHDLKWSFIICSEIEIVFNNLTFSSLFQ